MQKVFDIGGLCRDDYPPYDPSNPPSDALIVLGDLAFKHLGFDASSFDKKRGYVYTKPDCNFTIVPTYHPTFVRIGKMNLLQAMIYDLKVGVHKPIPEIPTDDLILYPSPENLDSWVEDALAAAEFGICDIETPYSQGQPEDDELLADPSSTIIRVSLGAITRSDHHVRAITFPFTPAYLPALRRFLASGLAIIFWNADYDVPRLELNECPITGMLIDAMWLYHFLFPDLPRSLASASSFYTNLGEWKSLSSTQQELYSALDSYATGKNFLGIRHHLQEKGMWDAAWNRVVRLQQVLRKMHKRGLLIHLQRLEDFKCYLTTQREQLQTLLNSSVPQHIRPVDVTLAKHLRGHCPCRMPKLGKRGQALKTLVANATCVTCSGSGWLPPIETICDFNPASQDQVKALIRALGHPVPITKDADGDDKETTEKRFLDDLGARYPEAPYLDVLEYRQFNKMLTTYGSWPLHQPLRLGVDSRIFAEASTKLTLVPATGRLSSVNPNMQNIPKEGALADAFKRCIVATPGHRLVKRDYSGIEAVLTGYFSGDPEYMRLALLGVHTYRCAQYHHEPPSLSLDDRALGAALKKLKAKYDVLIPGQRTSMYQKFKKINHMSNYKAGPKKIFNSSPGVFASLSEAKALHKFIYAQAPKLAQWHRNVEARCRKEHRIVTPYMDNRWFWDIPADLTKAVAEEPQSTAAAIIKEAMLIIDEMEAGLYMVLQVHDELIFDFPIAPGSCACHPDNTFTWQELDETVRQVMERPLAPLGGLIIHTEPASGDDYSCH